MKVVHERSEWPPQARTAKDEITLVQAHVAQAWASAEGAKQAGSQEEQIESFCMAEALEFQLERLLNEQHAARG